MSRPRVLCVSSDRSTRASVTLALTDTAVNVVVAQCTSDAVERLAQQSIDAIVIDASTVANVPALVDTVESESPETPTFVHWGDTETDAGSVAVLSEVVARTEDTESPDRLADAVAGRIDADSSATANDARSDSSAADETDESTAAGGSSATEGALGTDGDRRIPDLPDDLEAIVSGVRRRLVDVTSPVAVERILREEFTATDRFGFAWVGEYDRGEREVVPWLTDPDSMEWPMQRTFPIGDGEHPLLERALRTGELQTLQHIANNRDDVPFGDHAFDRGVHAIAVAPLSSSDDVYGVFVVYALEPFAEAERTAIRAAADASSHVLETIVARGALEQQERSLRRYERLVETAGDGMYVLDEHGHFMTVNDALTEMTGYSREGLLGEHASLVFDPDDIEAGEAKIRSLLSSGTGTDTLELYLETKTGDRIPCEVQIAVLVHDGEYLGSVAVIRDITERKRSERKLREQNERLDAFARIVSHDLRNPLSVAQGYLDLLEETESLEHAENVRDGLDRMESIVEDVLAIARDGQWATDTEPVDLESVAHDAWEYVSTADASLSVAETTAIEADRSRLLRLLENLFRNAVEHGSTSPASRAQGETGNDGDTGLSVRIGLLESGDGVDVEPRGFFVEDDGAGLPENMRQELFDPSVSSSSDGLGIGLWVVREVATGHGWSVTAAESEAGGARFEFAFDAESDDRRRCLN
ncbi:PAS domain S-box protein [Natronorubrum texcoconense]|uniref:histidine kinase n=1 Tax=Natronorubrum texcoconense TaxID=1095776 RepID=A0A1G8XWR1_9EURY|nr:PAS domain S-box protein [Natronorubrum texcoconense]SDJ94917.1 PAS domain S-box-containing protein [Natronorubrum texcoconense]